MDYHFTRDTVMARRTVTSYVTSRSQITDIFTKALSKKRFFFFITCGLPWAIESILLSVREIQWLH